MITGWREKRDPNEWFSTAEYLQENRDVAALQVNPFRYYLLYGRKKGQKLKSDLGFRVQWLTSGPGLERLIERLASHPEGAPTPIAVLQRALDRLGAPAALHLSVSHDDFTAKIGGIQLCLGLEARALRKAGIAHVHLFPAAPGIVVDVERAAPLLGLVLDGVTLGQFESGALARALGDWSAGAVPSFAVHSLIGHRVSDVIDVLRGAGARAGYFWVHDFASVCAHPHLLRNDVTFCGAPPRDSTACRLCDYGERRQIQIAEHARLFAAFEITAVAPSQAALDLWRMASSLTPKGTRLHPHARLEPRPGGARTARAGGSLRVGFLGAPRDIKGWPVFTELVKQFADDPRYEFHHLGVPTAGAAKARFTEVIPTPADPAPMRAAVERMGIEVAVLWSLCPETFCFSAYEAAAGGAAIVTNADSGNLAAFVEGGRRGMVLQDENNLFALFQTGRILTLLDEPGVGELADLSYSRMTADLIAGAGL